MALKIGEFLPQPGIALFCLPEFFRLHANEQAGLYYQWEEANRVVASIHFTRIGTTSFRSPCRGTFGGLAFDKNVSLDTLQHFWASIDNDLTARGATYLEILLPPASHGAEQFAKSYYVLQSNGFTSEIVDLNYSRIVDDTLFASMISAGNRKRLRKCVREGLYANAVPVSRLPDLYALLAANRARRGFPMTMSLTAIQQMTEVFPDKIFLYAVSTTEGALAAAAVCVQITEEILYVFYWGDAEGYQTQSPVVLLAEAIYADCQKRGIRILDAGTSTSGVQPNLGLMAFKVGLGFSESIKVRLARGKAKETCEI